ncbi:hypothetical protein DBY21_09580 [Candidatus Gastranaerophilales bacterium]|nr:MAG: hypothetical protein DBY21_09580 [Candidatus Gastranaerophilales bacterium]
MKKAFTMPEVLITLGIIGIVAAITLPALIGKYQKIQTINQLKKVYSILSQAIELSELKNENLTYWNYNQTSAEFFNQYIKPQLKTINMTSYGKISDKIQYTRPNGTIENTFTPFYSEALIVSTVDGTTFYLSNTQQYSYLPFKIICIDLNGYKKPNKFGKDFFAIVISKDYGLVPFGYKGTSDIGGYSKFDRNEIIKSQRYGCRKEAGDTNGAFCLGLIMADGWEIRDDYPW